MHNQLLVGKQGKLQSGSSKVVLSSRGQTHKLQAEYTEPKNNISSSTSQQAQCSQNFTCLARKVVVKGLWEAFATWTQEPHQLLSSVHAGHLCLKAHPSRASPPETALAGNIAQGLCCPTRASPAYLLQIFRVQTQSTFPALGLSTSARSPLPVPLLIVHDQTTLYVLLLSSAASMQRKGRYGSSKDDITFAQHGASKLDKSTCASYACTLRR